MPVTQSAKRALRRDRRRQIVNDRIRRRVKEAIKKFKDHPSEKLLKVVYSMLDRAAKKKVIHKNKAARLKSRLSRLVKKEEKKPQKRGTTKKSEKKTRVKKQRVKKE